jgi:hypothetical protein
MSEPAFADLEACRHRDAGQLSLTFMPILQFFAIRNQKDLAQARLTA